MSDTKTSSYGPGLRLLLKIADLMINNLQAWCDEHPLDHAASKELEEMCMLVDLMQITIDEQIKEEEPDYPKQIEAFILWNEPAIFPISVTKQTDKPLQFLLETTQPISHHTADLLDEMFPGLIILERKPEN